MRLSFSLSLSVCNSMFCFFSFIPIFIAFWFIMIRFVCVCVLYISFIEQILVSLVYRLHLDISGLNVDLFVAHCVPRLFVQVKQKIVEILCCTCGIRSRLSLYIILSNISLIISFCYLFSYCMYYGWFPWNIEYIGLIYNLIFL